MHRVLESHLGHLTSSSSIHCQAWLESGLLLRTRNPPERRAPDGGGGQAKHRQHPGRQGWESVSFRGPPFLFISVSDSLSFLSLWFQREKISYENETPLHTQSVSGPS